MRVLFLVCAALTVALLGPSAQADPFTIGDVFASVGSGKVNVFRPDGTFVQTLDTTLGSGETTGSAFDSAGNFYVTSFGLNNMSKFNNNGVLQVPNPFATNDAGSHNESITFDASGNMYIGQADGTRDIIKRDSSGTFVTSYNVATEGRGSDWVDLASDQKTIYYTSEGRNIMRYDVSTGTQLSNFATLPSDGGTAYALRILGDGGVLVADWMNIKRLDAMGNVIMTYDATGEDGFFAANLDPDGKTFWTGGYSTGMIYHFDLATGALLGSFSSNKFVTLAGLAVYGEITQGNPNGMPEPVAPILLCIAVVGVGILRRRMACA